MLPRMCVRKLTKLVAVGAATIALALGGFAAANSTSGNSGSGTASAAVAKVMPFHRGEPSPAKVVGQVPPTFRAGTGTIITGTAAEKAKGAAPADCAGGTVNRVVLLSSGEYNVHIIGVKLAASRLRQQ